MARVRLARRRHQVHGSNRTGAALRLVVAERGAERVAGGVDDGAEMRRVAVGDVGVSAPVNLHGGHRGVEAQDDAVAAPHLDVLGDDHALDAHRDALARLHEHFGDAREGVEDVGGVLGVFDVHGVFVVAEVRLRDDAVDARLVGEDELGGEHGVVLGAPDVLRRLERVAFGALFGLGATAGAEAEASGAVGTRASAASSLASSSSAIRSQSFAMVNERTTPHAGNADKDVDEADAPIDARENGRRGARATDLDRTMDGDRTKLRK